MRLTIASLGLLCCTIPANAQEFSFAEPLVNALASAGEDIGREVANLGEEAKRQWDNIRHLDPAGASEELWGEAGRVAYVAAARIMQRRSPTGQPLDDRMKYVLRRGYGDLVDRVTIHWGTPTLDEWAAARFKVRLTDEDSEAQTFGYDIYTRWAADEKSRTYLMALMSHELMHSKQYERYDRSLSNFGYHYFKEFKKANQSYENNKLEAEAFEDAPRVAAPNCCLVSQRGSEGTEAQRWRRQDIGNGYCVLINVRLSREIKANMVLDFVTEDNNAYLEIRRGKKGNSAQKWKITDIGHGRVIIENKRLSSSRGTSMVLDFRDGDIAYVERKRGEEGNSAQRWTMKSIGNGEYLIVNNRRTSESHGNMVLDYRE